MCAAELDDELRQQMARHLAGVVVALRRHEEASAIAAGEAAAAWVDQATIDPVLRARFLFQLGDTLFDAGAKAAASVHFSAAILNAQSSGCKAAQRLLGVCQLRLGAIARDAGRHGDAIGHYRCAIAGYTAGDDRLRVGAAYNNLGLTYHRAGDLAQAMQHYRHALEIGELLQDAQLIATARGNVGKTEFDTYAFAAAEADLRAAVVLTRTLNAPELLESQLGDLGNVLRGRGQFTAAAACYQEALALARATNSHRGEQLALGNLGALYLQRGEIGQALFHLEASYALTRSSAPPLEQIADLLHLSRVYSLLNDDRSQQCVEEALAICDTAGMAHPPEVLTAWGHVAHQRGDQAGAERAYRDALAAAEQAGDTLNLGTDWLNLGVVVSARGDWAEAQRHFERSIACNRAAENGSGLATALLNLGVIEMELNRLDDACAHLEEAQAVAQAASAPDDARQAWHNLGYCYWRQGREMEACQAMEQAIGWADQVRGTITLPHERIGYWPQIQDSFTNVLQMRLSRGESAAAWAALERMRSRSMVELLGTIALPPPQGMPEDLQGREELLLTRLRTLQATGMRTLSADERADWMTVNQELQAVWVEMASHASGYVAMRTATPLQWAEIAPLLVTNEERR